MKVYIVFKLEDPKAKKKNFIVDSLYTTQSGAVKRALRIHKGHSKRNRTNKKMLAVPLHCLGDIKSDIQETYVISKPIKGLLK